MSGCLVGLTELRDVLADCGWSPRMTIGTLAERVEADGFAVVPGWHDRPSVAESDADAFLGRVLERIAAASEREAARRRAAQGDIAPSPGLYITDAPGRPYEELFHPARLARLPNIAQPPPSPEEAAVLGRQSYDVLASVGPPTDDWGDA